MVQASAAIMEYVNKARTTIQSQPPQVLKKASLVFLLSIPLITTILSSLSNPPTVVHIIPHSHLDAGWKRTQQATFHSAAVPIFKRTVLELLLDEKRTAIFEPILFVTGWITNSGDSPLSVSSVVDGGFSNPLEMYVEAVKIALSEVSP